MSLAAALVIATIATLAVSAALLACARSAARAEGRSWMLELARTLLFSRLRHLPAEQSDRYREEYEADLGQLQSDPRAALMHALQAAAGTGRLTATLNGVAPRRRDQLARRALAHVGFPVSLNEPHDDADASYIFGGAMRPPR